MLAWLAFNLLRFEDFDAVGISSFCASLTIWAAILELPKMDEGCDSFEISNMKFESSFNLKEDPLLRQEGRDFNDLVFLRKGAKPFFGFLIFIGRETISLFGLVEEDLGNLVFFEEEVSLFSLDEEVLRFSIFFNGREPPFVLLFAKSMLLLGLEEEFVFLR
jgi:hypothetical protein